MSQTYIVKPGDTLYGISNQFGVSVTDLAELNNIKGSVLQVGTVLKIPTNPGTNPNTMFMYTVVSGDTLYKIAQKYNTTVDEIINLNYLKSPNLSIGQVLRIPEMYTKEEDMIPPNYTTYVVKKGDSLYSISNAFNVTVDTILKDNGLKDQNLSIGQVLKIRFEEDIIEECFGEDYTPPDTLENSITYVVKKGDNLYDIAKRYNTSTSNIMKLNNLLNNNLSIGQVLKIPYSNTAPIETNVYTVVAGDNLYNIARKFNTTVDEIKRLNSLTSNNLSIGQNLTVPAIGSSITTYTVVSGDSLYSIARKFNTTVDNIKNKNNLKSNLLSVGQKLII